MTDNNDVNCTNGNVNDDFIDDKLLINFFENESFKVDMDKDSGLGDDSSTFSDEYGDAGHTIIEKKSTSIQKQYVPNDGYIIVKKEIQTVCIGDGRLSRKTAFVLGT
eukprot:2484111-Ditylum_brightwellii.AAC.1